jgi:hypothetical protein
VIVIKNKVKIPQNLEKMTRNNRHMNVVIWKQQFSNCSYPRISHTDSDVLLNDLTTI